MYFCTGNTGSLDGFAAPPVWSGGEALLRFQPGPVFTNSTRDFFAPADWRALDDADTDIGSSGALLVDLPGAVPSALVVAMGKNGVVYLADRNNLGGVGGGVFQAKVSDQLQRGQRDTFFRIEHWRVGLSATMWREVALRVRLRDECLVCCLPTFEAPWKVATTFPVLCRENREAFCRAESPVREAATRAGNRCTFGLSPVRPGDD